MSTQQIAVIPVSMYIFYLSSGALIDFFYKSDASAVIRTEMKKDSAMRRQKSWRQWLLLNFLGLKIHYPLVIAGYLYAGYVTNIVGLVFLVIAIISLVIFSMATGPMIDEGRFFFLKYYLPNNYRDMGLLQPEIPFEWDGETEK